MKQAVNSIYINVVKYTDNSTLKFKKLNKYILGLNLKLNFFYLKKLKY